MRDDESTSGPSRTEGEAVDDRVVVASFPESAAARRGMSELRRLEDEGVLTVWEAAVIGRDEEGSWHTVDEEDKRLPVSGARGGGLAGAVVGLVGGPAGVMLGGAAGADPGTTVDRDPADQAGQAGQQEETFPMLVPAGTVAVVAQVNEPDPSAFDTAVSGLGGRVHRLTHEELRRRGTG